MTPGRYYMRPCVRAIWLRDANPQWIPILGPVHDDAEIIGFRPRHWHVDYRFLTKKQRTIPKRHPKSHQPYSPVFSIPISMVQPDTGNGDIQVSVGNLPDPMFPPQSYFRVMKRRMSNPYPQYPHHLSHGAWMGRLEAAFQDRELLPGPVCPHKLAPLVGIEPDPDGCVTCPLHGLHWDLGTGRLVPVVITDPAQEKTT